MLHQTHQVINLLFIIFFNDNSKGGGKMPTILYRHLNYVHTISMCQKSIFDEKYMVEPPVHGAST